MHPNDPGWQRLGLQLHLYEISKGFPPWGSPLHPLQHPPCLEALAHALTVHSKAY